VHRLFCTEQPSVERHAFAAETASLLNIVAKSLYTDKEVFLREVVSNASDACEKLRFLQNQGETIVDPHVELGIHIHTDETSSSPRLVIEDRGVGMTKGEMMEHLGTIAKSGSKAFLEKHQSVSEIIGQFGVGFYSVFMVAEKARVTSRTALQSKVDAGEGRGHVFESDVSGYYTISEASEAVPRGTKIELSLTKDNAQFAKSEVIESLVGKYSRFVPFPIHVNGKRVNADRAVWRSDPKSLSSADYKEFFQMLASANEEPRFHLHFSSDFPIQLRSVIFVPSTNKEKFGMGRTESGISLYSRKVLIQKHARNVSPDWMRFLVGVVDCDDIPLNISRESMQDTQLMGQISNAVTRKVISWLKARERPEYELFFREFGAYIKEGCVTDASHRSEMAPLLLFHSSHKSQEGGMVSLDDYCTRNEGSSILYVHAPSVAQAQASPYVEAFAAEGMEVLFATEPVDEFVFNSLGQYRNRRFLPVSSSEAQKILAEKEPKPEAKKDENVEGKSSDSATDSASTDDKADYADFVQFVQKTLDSKVDSVQITRRVTSAPMMVLDHESPTLRRMIKLAAQNNADAAVNFAGMLGKHQIQIAVEHPLLKSVSKLREKDAQLAELAVEQLYDNALILAGIQDEPRDMVPRINKILEHALKSSQH
jgi:molecular chaperone HtpG